MSATWVQIYSPEPAIEDAVRQLLQAIDELALPIYRRMEAAEMDPGRIEVTCIRGEETGHRGQYLPGKFTADAWNAALRITVRGQRSTGGRAAMWAALARIRLAMTPAAALFTEANLPFHAIAQFEPQPIEPSLDNAGNEDGTVLPWAMTISVRKGCLPASEPGS